MSKLQESIISRVSTQWYELGNELLIDLKYLKTIKSKYGSDHWRCCFDMFEHWLGSNRNATWHQLIISLQSPKVELYDVAADIEKMISGKIVRTFGIFHF